MNSFRTFAIVLLLGIGQPVLASENGGSGDPRYAIQNPPAYAMIGDLLIARPLLVAATVIGAGVFVVSLPFTALGGGVGDAGKALVVDPAKAAFVRCLGCVGDGFEERQ
ncbi:MULTISPECIES: multidrug transporter [unclassified Pseudomonas]|uniref:multidrug transporter n=1 Tax=unclassified Pseudomonas TaxID=196821 RepID=UPI002AC93248|nr:MULTISPECIES: multidrug transporter [unclassified Pseudomonas]MEB0044011.1 multidrug transporter [Pseudomonas sp. Dout3]MEB0095051.1 multidrug transporter [Pseudomonas sp. DC1.2]WPX58616.1 multidrug transporter [Pseudomonas sp. DC1.2]